MEGIISLGINFEKRVEITIENDQVIDHTVKDFDQYREVTEIAKPYFFALDSEGQRNFTEEEFEQFLIDNEKLIDLFGDIDLLYQTSKPYESKRKIKRSIDFFENQLNDLKEIDKNQSISVQVRNAVDEYIHKHK